MTTTVHHYNPVIQPISDGLTAGMPYAREYNIVDQHLTIRCRTREDAAAWRHWLDDYGPGHAWEIHPNREGETTTGVRYRTHEQTTQLTGVTVTIAWMELDPDTLSPLITEEAPA